MSYDPARRENKRMDGRISSASEGLMYIFRGSSVVERCAVNAFVAGSNPALGAISIWI